MLSCWNRLHRVFLPWVPKSNETFVSIMFWHSILMTFTTPLFRLFNDHWRGEHILYCVVTALMPRSVVEFSVRTGFIHAGLDYAREGERPVAKAAPIQGIDISFGLHAGFALMWLICSYIQMVHADKIAGTKRWLSHRVFGYVAFTSFFCHIFASNFNLFMNVLQHKPLPRIMLIITSMSSITYMIKAIRVARHKPEGWLKSHQDNMMLCYLRSIQGAGPIREVAQLQQWLGCGPVLCQNQNGGLATNCMWPYVFRMFVVQFDILWAAAAYCKMRGDSKLLRDFLWDFLQKFVMLVVMLAFSYMPYNEEILAFVLGHEGTLRGSFSVLLCGFLTLYVDLNGLDTAPQVVNRRLQHSRSLAYCRPVASCRPCSTPAQKDDYSSTCMAPMRCISTASTSASSREGDTPKAAGTLPTLLTRAAEGHWHSD